MPSPDPSGIPEAGPIDFSGDSVVRSGSDEPSSADMDALMQSAEGDASVVAEGGAAAPAAEPGELPAPPAQAAAPAAEAAPAVAAEPAAPAEPTAPAVDVRAEEVRIRKGWADIARAKESLVTKTAEANAAIANAQSFKTKAEQYDAIPRVFEADPLAFIFQIAGKKTTEEQDAFVNDVLLNKVIEREKSPAEREIARLRAEIAAKEQATATAQEQAAAREAQAQNDRIYAEWEVRNAGFAASTTENVEKYDLINSLGQGAAVHEVCKRYFQKHNVVLDPSVAADHVETRLRAGLQKSKAAKTLFTPPAVVPVAATKPSNGTTAPKQTGTTTLSSVASGDGAPPVATVMPEDNDDRFDAVLRDMQRSGELPDEWRPRAS